MNWIVPTTTTMIVLLCLTQCVFAKSPAPAPPAGADQLNAFADRLYRAVDGDKPDSNLFFSPASVGTALAMTSAGARGDTLKEMTTVLGYDPGQAGNLHAAYAGMLRQWSGAGKPAAERGYQLTVANRLWAQRGYALQAAFVDLTDKTYNAPVEALDFDTDSDGSRKVINAWVEKQTADKIKDLIKPGMLPSDARLVLTNAIYFKGDWDKPFDKKLTKDETFHLRPGPAKKTITVPLMHRTGGYRYAEDEAMKYLEIPYAKRELAMLVMLPKNAEDFKLVKGFEPKYLANVNSRLKPRDTVRVWLPRFRMTSEFELSKPLKAMGMPLAFSNRADFGAMTSAERLKIDQVIHKAFVDVNEEGTEAAAATGVIMRTTAFRPEDEPAEFRADRPFAFLIRDTRSGAILFAGKVINPKGE